MILTPLGSKIEDVGRTKPTPAPSSSTTESLAALVEKLTQQVVSLDGRLAVLTTAIDELREEVQWAIRNDKLSCTPKPVMHITSLPRDPLAPDFGERINRLSGNDVPAEDDAPGEEVESSDDAGAVSEQDFDTSVEQRSLWE